MTNLDTLSTTRFSYVAYLDATRQAIREGLDATLVNEHGRYGIQIGDLRVRVAARRKDRGWAPDEALQEGADAIVGVDYSHSQDNPAFYVMLVQPGLRRPPQDSDRDQWGLLRE